MPHMRLRTGAALTVLDISAFGALVESTARLLPGSTVDVHVTTPAGRIVARTLVVRSAVSALAAGRIEYRSGLAFAHAIDLSGGVTLSVRPDG